MIIRTLVVGAVLAIALFSLPADSAEQPRLRPIVTVHGGLVTLGDLIEHAGAVSHIAVFRSPELGTAGTVRADRILAAARANGLTDLTTDGVASVSVSRIGRTIGADEITGVIAARMVHTGRADRMESVDIELDGNAAPLVIESSAVAAVAVDQFDYDPRNGRFSAILKVADSAATASGIRVSGRAVEIVEVPVLARAVSRGELIAPSDIVIDRIAKTTLPAGTVIDAGRLAGMSARRSLREGIPLADDDLMEPILVQRGDIVTMVFRSPGLTLTTRGRALSAGARGEVVPVHNIQSKRTIEAEITASGIVTVMPKSVPVAALQTVSR